MNKDHTAYLLLMRDSFAKIATYTAHMSYANFVSDSKTQSAVIMQLQVAGELAKKVPELIKNSIDIPWKQIAGLRDLVAHDYFHLDLGAIWRTVQENVPAADTSIKSYLLKSHENKL